MVADGAVMADNFTFPQGVYSGEEVNLTEYPNGGVVNATLLERISLTQPVEPYKWAAPGS